MFLSGLVIVSFEFLAMGAYVHKKYGGVEIAGDMLLGDHGLLDGIGAAD